jgi:hypothetical protein
MAPKADVEQVVNPIAPLEDDDDPFLVRATAGCCAMLHNNTAIYGVYTPSN